MRVILHQVPQDRPVTDLHHWLWDYVGEIAHSHPLTTTKEHDFHKLCFSGPVPSNRELPRLHFLHSNDSSSQLQARSPIVRGDGHSSNSNEHAFRARMTRRKRTCQ